MSEGSKIEWTDDTYNPWRGCKKVSPGCAHCYAEVSTPVRVARSEGRELWGGKLRDRLKDLDAPLRWNKKPWVCETCGKPDDKHQDHSCTGRNEDACHTSNTQWHRRRVFCLSLGDWLDPDVPIEWLSGMIKTIHDTPNLDWLLLTKRPELWRERMESVRVHCNVNDEKKDRSLFEAREMARQWIECEKYPENVWIGTTVENQEMADKRIPLLLQIPAKVRFLSVEPMLGAVDLIPFMGGNTYECKCGWKRTENEMIALSSNRYICRDCDDEVVRHDAVNWVICGGESGFKRRQFNIEWARSLRDQCAETKTPFFFKQVDKVRPIPNDLMIRQFPKEMGVYQ